MSSNLNKINHAQPNQAPKVPRGVYQHIIITTPSSSVPSVGSFFCIDLKQKNIQIHKLSLLFNVTSSRVSTPLNPAWCWFNHIDLVIGGTNIIDTLYPDFNFIRAQSENVDADRTMMNYNVGNYLDLTSNSAKWADGLPHYATLNLSTFYNQANVPLLTNGHELQLRVYLNDASYWLTNVENVGAPIVINSCSLISSVTLIPDAGAQAEILQIAKVPKDYMFTTTLHSIYSQVAGTNTANITLTSLTGSIHAVYFTIKATNALNYSNWFNFMPISQFTILSASGTNIVGGSPILNDFGLLELSSKWFPGSTFFSESYSGVNPSYVYCYSFSNDMHSVAKNASHNSTYKFIGSEQLQIVFPTNLPTDVQIDVWGAAEAGIRLGSTFVQKILI